MSEDQDIVDRVRRGEKAAFTELVRRHQKLVWHVVSRLLEREEDREDLCQEIFMKVFSRLDGFRFEAKLSTWIASIAYRMSINYLKKQRKYHDTDLEQVSLSLSSDELPADRQMDREHLHSHIQALIAGLPPQYRTMITLYHLEEMPYQEIAKVTGVPEGTVKSYLFRARKRLKELLEKDYLKEELR